MFEYETDEDRNFFRRHRELIFIGVTVILGASVFIAGNALWKSNQRPVDRDELTMVILAPTPPPPLPTPKPTPPPPEPTPEQQEDHRMVEQPPVQDVKKPDPPKAKAPDAPGPLGTTIAGPGGGQDLGLGLGPGGGGGNGPGDGGGGGGKYDWYASEIQNRIAEVVRDDARVRRVTMHVVVRIWPDANGRISRAAVSSSGDSRLDALVQNQILTGIQLAEAPPADMPLPIVMRLSIEQSR